MPERPYLILIEGTDEQGSSAYAPDLPGCVAAGATRPVDDGAVAAGELGERVAVDRARGQAGVSDASEPHPRFTR